MKHTLRVRQSARQPLVHAALTPVALAALLACAQVRAQTAPAGIPSSADDPARTGQFDSAGQAGIGPRPFTSFFERLSSPVDKIGVKVSGNNLPADGVSATDVVVQLLDGKGMPVRDEVEVTIEVDGGARVWLPGRATPETGADRGDIDRIQPGVQVTARGGELRFKLVAPYRPEAVNLRVSVRGVAEKVVVRYVPDLREMIVVGLIEGQLRSDKFDPSKIVPVRENDSFDQEIRAVSKEFNGGRSRLGLRAAVYLKGKVKGEYLLTLAYDSEKDTRRRLFQDIDPNAFYPVYGDSSTRGADAQSSGKLYVRLDKGLNYAMWGDYTTADPNVARQLSQYGRSLPGLRAHYEDEKITANGFLAHQTMRQVVDEFPGRGVSGPYAVSNPNGVAGTEVIEILVRDRNQPSIVLKATTLTRSTDYEFEPFDGKILFRSPVPSFDDQLNPVSIRVTYEVEQGGNRYLVYGGDAKLKLSDTLTVGVAAARDENPQAPFDVVGANLHLKLSKNTELIAEVAHTRSVVNAPASGFNTNNSNNFIGKSGEVRGNAYRVELRHTGDDLRGRAYIVKTDDDFNNASAGITGGKLEAGAAGTYRVNEKLTVNGEVRHSEDRIANTRSDALSLGADLKLTDRLTIGAGVRHVSQDALTLVALTGNSCSTGATGTTTGYNSGYGISQQGNQQIDPATGLPVLCSPTNPTTVVAPVALDRSSLFARATYRLTDTFVLSGELQRELGADSTTLYRVGADWQLAPKTRAYARYEHSRTFGGAYGLGVGATAGAFTLGMDTQYMEDGSLFTEYRLRDSANGKEVQAAVGLRNGWKLGEGLRLLTNVERLNSTTGNATALGLGLEYTASELWKGSGRIDWREDASNTNWLLTLSAARKLNRDWTLLARDYLSIVDPRVVGAAHRRQNRFLLGFAYRPVDNNKFDALGMYERKTDHDIAGATNTNTDIISFRANYHPSRPWWLSGRVAYKRVNELLLGTVNDGYHATLLGTRVSYDITNRWSLGALMTVMQGKGGARQFAYGLEVGYIVADNLWVTLGYNFRGFRDDDLTGSDYTNRGWVLGVRYKFDETLFDKKDSSSNKTLTPATPGKP